MSKIGVKPVTIPEGVTISVDGGMVVVKGPKGELSTVLQKGITIEVKEDSLQVSRANDSKQTKAFHGLVRSLINNDLIGVTQGYKKTLKMVGTGYRVTKKGQGISLAVGYSHPVEMDPADGTTINIEGNDTIHIEGIDKQKVGQLAAEIRKVRPPEPYKGKGIRYQDEVVRRKQGKAAVS